MTETGDNISAYTNLSPLVDTVTGLPNHVAFERLVQSELMKRVNTEDSFALLFFEIDNLFHINDVYGHQMGDETLSAAAYLLNNYISARGFDHSLFRLQAASFVYYIPSSDEAFSVRTAEEINLLVYQSDTFIETMTISVGVVNALDFLKTGNPPDQMFHLMYDIGKSRVQIARRRGKNNVCHTSSLYEAQARNVKILIIEPDRAFSSLLRISFEKLGYTVLQAGDGPAAIEFIKNENPDLVISEVMVPKVDGFLIRETMLSMSIMRQIPFILASFQKDDHTVQRALSLDIQHYFKKPLSPVELVGLSRLIVEKNKSQ